jgi:hypothetical protein
MPQGHHDTDRYRPAGLQQNVVRTLMSASAVRSTCATHTSHRRCPVQSLRSIAPAPHSEPSVAAFANTTCPAALPRSIALHAAFTTLRLPPPAPRVPFNPHVPAASSNETLSRILTPRPNTSIPHRHRPALITVCVPRDAVKSPMRWAACPNRRSSFLMSECPRRVVHRCLQPQKGSACSSALQE